MILFRLLPALPAVVLLAGCLPIETYHKTGAPVARVQSDEVECKVDALKQVPVNTVTRSIPGQYVPGRKICNPRGCYRTAGHMTPPRIESYDSNAGLRGQVVEQCMQAQGYKRVKLERCTATGAMTLPATQPALNTQSCLVRAQNDQWVIVTP
ncbi:hypothetical protein DI396_04930 [Litorivita pollutaquae]|uniref:Uncharacterized protein n=1 Tax=Litorivita pollutaquae TaxID=2200892 RepID=A0A2V4NEJ7_9RHOB|nr:hypothetical protein [Litorivita pollutaquae]PYC48340.1 hypothetical protein DI396_04930 [Litorivita pollutaquae]